MAALELAQTTLASPQVSKTFLNQLVEKEFLTEEARDGILADEELCQFITTGKKARKKSTKKQSPSDEERNKEHYDPSRCPCRIWKPIGGMIGLPNVQCSKKLPGGESMCKMHSGKIGDGKWWLGFVNEDPPEEPMFGDHLKNPNKAHWWTSEAKEAAESKNKAEKKKVKKEVEDEEEGEEEPKEVKKKVKKVKKKVKKVKKKEPEEEEEEEEEPKKVKKKEKVKKEKVKKEPEEEEEDDGAGTGLKFDQDLSEDESEEKEFVFEGVTYKKTPEGEIIDHEYNYIGDDDGEGGITFTDDDALERHEENKASL